MGLPQVRVVASWDGWCGTCRVERPLVLTRTGRRGLRAWWAGVGLDDLALTLTCRLCGVGVDVPPREDDDPEVVATAEPAPTAAPVPGGSVPAGSVPLVRVSVDDAWPAADDDVLDLLAAGVPALVADRS